MARGARSRKLNALCRRVRRVVHARSRRNGTSADSRGGRTASGRIEGMRISRRDWLLGLAPAAALAQEARKGRPLDITEFKPRSALVVPETKIERAKFPVIDVHTHLCWSKDQTN